MTSLENLRASLRSATLASLVAEARRGLAFTSATHLPSARRIVQDEPRSEAALLAALRSLLSEIRADDEANGRAGRDSYEFELYDAGLGLVAEVLEERVRSRPTT